MVIDDSEGGSVDVTAHSDAGERPVNHYGFHVADSSRNASRSSMNNANLPGTSKSPSREVSSLSYVFLHLYVSAMKLS